MWNELSQVIKSFGVCVRVRVHDLCDLLVICTVFARMGYGKGKKRQYRIYLRNENIFFFLKNQSKVGRCVYYVG